MKLDQLTEVFVKQVGARKEGPAYIVPHDVEVSLFVGLEGETLAIPRVTKLEAQATLVFIDTMKHERFIVPAEDIRVIKVDLPESSQRERSAGFGK